MNSAFVGYEELSRSRRVLSTSADNTLLDLLNSSYPTQPHSLIAKYLHYMRLLLILRCLRSTDTRRGDSSDSS